MTGSSLPTTRRRFMELSAAAGAASMASSAMGAPAPAAPAARYRRYNVTSPEGQRMLASYARGVAAMLALPPDHPQNWFRNAFIHLMDCPHGNWWFYVWHRGYIGYFEQTIRKLSGDPAFTLPYWDWTQLPQLPDGMFNGPLDPANAAFQPYTRDLSVFTKAFQPALTRYWATLSADQKAQLVLRGYPDLGTMWNDVTGYVPAEKYAIAGNIAFAPTCSARYPTRANPKFDARTAATCTPFVISTGLMPQNFWSSDIKLSFASGRTPSHNTAPSGATQFSIIEGQPHNKIHNYIGGVGPLDPGPYGNMTNFLSPVDPIFFLHHANIDRLWTVWEAKQRRLGLPVLPAGADLKALSDEPFLFYADGNGGHVGPATAGQYLSTAVFDYDYQPGSGLMPFGPAKAPAVNRVMANKSGGDWAAALPSAAVGKHLAATQTQPLIAEITVARPGHAREFDVLINAPAGVTQVEPDSPYYAGTIAFFGPAMNHPGHEGMEHLATFAIPLPQRPALFKMTEAMTAPISIRLAPTVAGGANAELRAVAIAG